MGQARESLDLLPGTLDLLILKVLARETMHGYGIAQTWGLDGECFLFHTSIDKRWDKRANRWTSCPARWIC